MPVVAAGGGAAHHEENPEHSRVDERPDHLGGPLCEEQLREHEHLVSEAAVLRAEAADEEGAEELYEGLREVRRSWAVERRRLGEAVEEVPEEAEAVEDRRGLEVAHAQEGGDGLRNVRLRDLRCAVRGVAPLW